MASRRPGQEYRQKEDAAGRPLFARDGSPILEPARDDPPPATPERRGRTLLIVGLVLTGFVVLLLIVLATTKIPGSGDDRYTQTWPTPYASTTCGAWSSQMSAEQRFAGSSDILTELRRAAGVGAGRPADALITAFESGITSTCALSAASPVLTAGQLVFELDAAYRS